MSNNQAEYEALILGINLAREMGVENLRAQSDSQVVTSQMTGGIPDKGYTTRQIPGED